MSQLKIEDRIIGEGQPAFIVAELSANHQHKIEIAIDTIRAAKNAGADAIKLQTYTADLLTLDCDNEYFQINTGTIWDGKTLHSVYQEAYTPWEWHPELFRVAREEGLICFSSPFDPTAVDFLENLGNPIYKIASPEILDLPLIRKIAKLGKPLILSTGMATLAEVEEAVRVCEEEKNMQFAILKCTATYPTLAQEVNLRAMCSLENMFGCVVGISDHTLGSTVPIASIPMGCKIIEKHFILDRSIGGPDASFSLDFEQFKKMVDAVRITELALGNGSWEITLGMKRARRFGRSLFIVKSIKAGEVFDETNVRSIRPGMGLPPKFLSEILGKKASIEIESGTPLAWDMVQ